MKPTDALDDQIFLALKEVHQKIAREQSFKEIASALAHVGDTYLPLIESRGEDWKAQELRRRIAEDTLTAATVTGRSPDECVALLERVIALGFTGLDIKAMTICGFCSYCVDKGDARLALHYLTPLISEVETQHSRTGEDVWSYHLRICQDIRDRIERLEAGNHE